MSRYAIEGHNTNFTGDLYLNKESQIKTPSSITGPGTDVIPPYMIYLGTQKAIYQLPPHYKTVFYTPTNKMDALRVDIKDKERYKILFPWLTVLVDMYCYNENGFIGNIYPLVSAKRPSSDDDEVFLPLNCFPNLIDSYPFNTICKPNLPARLGDFRETGKFHPIEPLETIELCFDSGLNDNAGEEVPIQGRFNEYAKEFGVGVVWPSNQKTITKESKLYGESAHFVGWSKFLQAWEDNVTTVEEAYYMATTGRSELIQAVHPISMNDILLLGANQTSISITNTKIVGRGMDREGDFKLTIASTYNPV